MKVFIPFVTRDIGGPSTFAKKFKTGFEQRGHEVVFEECSDYDILLIIVQAPWDILLRAKKRKKPIVQRLDGVYYWSVSGWKYPLLNLKALLIRHLFANFTVYQSQYSKYCSNKFLRKKFPDPSTIIYNGVDLETFSPDGPKMELRDNPNQKIFFTASEFRRRDQLLPILKALTYYHDTFSSEFKFVIAGNFHRELSGFENTLKAYPWVKVLGKIPNEDLPSYERASDVFLFTHLNPPCPNNIIEALACGLPVCGVADGAMPELITSGKQGLLIKTTGQAYWRRRSYDTHQLADHINTILKNRFHYAQASRQDTEQSFSLEKMVDAYENIFQKLL